MVLLADFQYTGTSVWHTGLFLLNDQSFRYLWANQDPLPAFPSDFTFDNSMHQIFIVLNIIVAVAFLLSGIDDLFIDLFYWTRELYRKVVLRKQIHPITQADLAKVPEKWAAVWIPA